MYFDGQVLKGTPVNVHSDAGQLVFFLGDTQHSVALQSIKRSESFGNAPIVLELPNGATLEFDRESSLNTLKFWNVLSLSWFEKVQYHPTQWLLISLIYPPKPKIHGCRCASCHPPCIGCEWAWGNPGRADAHSQCPLRRVHKAWPG